MNRDRQGIDGAPLKQPLSYAQKLFVGSLFQKYDLNQLSADDARVIFQLLEEAGLSGATVREAVIYSGMDPEKFWTLTHAGGPAPLPPQPSPRRDKDRP
jgi:hypothetical protein